WVANQAYNRYDLMIPDIRKVQNGLENGFQMSRPAVEEELLALIAGGDDAGFRKRVNEDGRKVAKEATDAYRDLGIYLLVKYMDGNMKKTDADGKFLYNEYGLPEYPSFPGYDKGYYENIVRSTGDRFKIK
ncbi:MAG: dipeptidase, partial [Muribaculaceae bacterium]|nr:dipeptidase [Muribaculaceae bacterium]